VKGKNMKKIDLSKYEVEVKNQNGELIKVPYDVKHSLISIMFSEHMKHSSQSLIDYSELKEKIKSSDDFILLESTEYDKVLRAVDSFSGYREIDLEFVRRIKSAKEIEVTEKKITKNK
jgi:hypothetical protein